MNTDNRWESFRGFEERGAAEALCVQLQHDGVPCKVETRAVESGIDTHGWVLIPKSLTHRAPVDHGAASTNGRGARRRYFQP